MNALRRLLSPEYWIVAEPGPLGRVWVVYLALGIAFAAGTVLALWLLLEPPRRWGSREGPWHRPAAVRQLYACFEICVSSAGLLVVWGRFLGWPGWSARIWPPFLALLAAAGAVAYHLRSQALPVWLYDHLRILALLPPAQKASTPQQASLVPAPGPLPTGAEGRAAPPAVSFVLGICVHLLGLSLVLQARFGWPCWLSPLFLAGLLAPQSRLVLWRRRPDLRALTPMLAAYLVALVWSLYHLLGVSVIGWQGLAFPDPMSSFFYVDGILLASAVYSLLCSLAVIAGATPPLRSASRPRRGPTCLSTAWRWVAVVLLLATSAWAASVYLGKRTHGATGSDPYAYTQMSLDLATHQTLLHRFPLFQEVEPLGIAWGPVLPIGYHLPRNEMGDSASVWATGASVLLAAGYLLLGEVGLYVTTPVVALLALIATWALVQEVLRGESRTVRYLTGALTVALTATSPEHVDRLLVPMADAATQLFTLLTLVFCLRAMRKLGENPRRAITPLILGGMSFAWAYWARHTQLVLLVPIGLGILLASRQVRLCSSPSAVPTEGRRVGTKMRGTCLYSLWPLLLFATAALLMAIPDTLYRVRVFGGIFATETTELPAMGLQNIGPVARQLLGDALVAGEWGYLFPLAAIGACLLARRYRRQLAVLSGTFVVVLLVHLTYRFLRLRDLISLFPVVNLAISYGAVSLVRSTRGLALRSRNQRQLGPVVLSFGLVAWVVLGLALARWTMIDDLWKPGWASFGYMRPDQRAAFDRLAELTPPQSVIGASLNAGAVMMYTGRDAVRPYDTWTPDEWSTFVDAMRSGFRPIYLLDDGKLMADFIQQQEPHFRLVPIEALSVPLFNAQDRDMGWLYRLERTE